MKLLAVLGVVWMFCVLGLAMGAFALSIYGLVLAFQASVILGVLALIIEPSPFVFGAVMYFFSTNIPELIVKGIGGN